MTRSRPANPVSRPGDVWLLGRHRLVCGDSTDAEAVAAALGGVRPHLMVTDPPYGVDYDPAWRNRAGLSATRRTAGIAIRKRLKKPSLHRPGSSQSSKIMPGRVRAI